MEEQVTIQIYYVELKAYVKRGVNPLLLCYTLLSCK